MSWSTGKASVRIAVLLAVLVAGGAMLRMRRRGEADLLLVRNLDAGYAGVPVLRGLDFTIATGRTTVLPSCRGAAPSTGAWWSRR